MPVAWDAFLLPAVKRQGRRRGTWEGFPWGDYEAAAEGEAAEGYEIGRESHNAQVGTRRMHECHLIKSCLAQHCTPGGSRHLVGVC